MNDQVLIALGRSFVVDAGSLKASFARHGLAIEEIEASVHNLEAAVLENSNARAVHASSVQKWDAVLDDALAKLRRSDLLIENVLKNNPIATSEYETARTIPKPAGRKTEKKEVPAAPLEAAATTAA
jgi:hypothetical protein